MDAQDEAAFCRFVTSRSTALLRAAYLLTGDRGDAEDAVQVALTRVYLAWPRIRHREAVDAYTRRTLVREVGSWHRRRRVRLVLSAAPPESPASGAQAADQVADQDRLQQALLALPARQRTVVVLRFYEDLSERDVADVLGISTGAVKQHTSRALARLRTVLASLDELSEEIER